MAEHEEQRAPSSSLVWPSRDSCRQSQQRPTLCAVAGPNGSGKTTTTELLLANEWGANSLYINPDNIAEQEFGGWNNVEAVLKAAQRATEMRYQCLDERRDFVFETVFSSKEKLEFLRTKVPCHLIGYS